MVLNSIEVFVGCKLRVKRDEHRCILSALSLLAVVAKCAEEAILEFFERVLEQHGQVINALRAVLCQANKEILEDDRILILSDLAAQLFSLNCCSEKNGLGTERFQKFTKLFHILLIETGEEMRHQILDESVKLNLEDGVRLVFLKV